MNSPVEVVIFSDSSEQLGSAGVLDPQTGNTLITYKSGGVVPPRSLCVLGNDYLLSADQKKPLLHAWALNSHEPVHQGIRLVTPGRVSALAATPDGSYCIIAVEEKLYVWQIASGCLLAVADMHFSRVNVVKFVDDGSHFVSAGEDCMVAVWSLAQLVSADVGQVVVHDPSKRTEPRHIFRDHSLPVHDLHIGRGGMHARLFTASMDRTCKVHDLASNMLLLTVVFESCLTAVIVDPVESEAFVGTVTGDVYQFSLREPPRALEQLVHRDKNVKMFTGHKGAVTSLSVSLDSLTLLSGAEDSSIIFWHIPSRQATKTVSHKGPVTNAFFCLASKQIFAENFRPHVVLHSLQRSIAANMKELVVDVITTEENDGSYEQEPQQYASLESVSYEAEYLQKIVELKKINAMLYKFAAEKLLQPFADAVAEEEGTVQRTDAPSLLKKKKKKRIRKKMGKK
ncbi:hypothetical protein PR048_033614 [Dryococelus australis]|uniref:WD repeat-containing protein 18 n=1 Tax=Dryococelus australis TaxID=614101 RepID=A0ABQ9G0T3_9NEOP|nr:hypothetical protein PR048_033614 [Dryococelus australis]